MTCGRRSDLTFLSSLLSHNNPSDHDSTENTFRSHFGSRYCTQFKSFAMTTSPAHLVSGRGKELRIARLDESCTPYSREEFLAYYTRGSGWTMWEEAVPYKDAAGNIRHMLVKIGEQSRWGLVDRISQESGLLAGLISCDDDSPVLDLRGIVGCDLSFAICDRILGYLCGSDSEWWENAPPMGALDAADKLGLERLLSSIVRSVVKDRWEGGRSYLNASGLPNLTGAHNDG